MLLALLSCDSREFLLKCIIDNEIIINIYIYSIHIYVHACTALLQPFLLPAALLS